MVINLKKLLLFIFIPLFLAFLIGSFSDTSTYINSLNKPYFSPPQLVFPIVWSILYILMGISSYIIFNSSETTEENKKISLILYGVQLIFNLLWTPIFFNLELYFISFIWIILLIITVLLMIISFFKVSPLAAILQIPYLIWLIFAAYLNYSIYILNI